MTAINLFLNGFFHGEIMWADALDPSDFRMSYALSYLPFGIFRIEQKVRSPLWQANQTSGNTQEKVDKAYLLSKLKDTGQQANGSQLNLF